MKNSLRGKLHSEHGVNRLVTIAAVLAVVLILALLYPAYRLYKRHADEIGCMTAMKKAQDMLDVEFLGNYSLTLEEAIAVAERSKWEMDTVCPAGGDYYLVERQDNDQKYRIVCGLHDPDTAERTRLNAAKLLGMLDEAVFEYTRYGKEVPESIPLRINSRELEAQRLDEPNNLRYGTDSSTGYKGTQMFFTLAEDGSISWFVYADPNHAAVWRDKDVWSTHSGWSGDAFAS